jgi:4a-hydroxytetrahydrobiopterin dehydratase
MSTTSKLAGRQEIAEGTMAFRFKKPPGWIFEAGQAIDITLLAPSETDAEGNTRTFTILRKRITMTAAPAKLTNFQIESLLTQLPGWTVVAGKLHREYRFPNFGKAFGFMKTAAPAIEKMDHHPEWFNAYDRVVVDLTTHDAGGISQKDVDLAKRLEEIASKLI